MTQIAIVLYPSFTALDLVGPYESLHYLPSADVRFVWHQTGPLTADSGVLTIGATHTFEETSSPDVVLVPGGPGSVRAAQDEVLLSWLRQVSTTADWTTSVCSGSVILAAAGLLTDRRATSHWITLPVLKTFGAVPVGDERIVVEGRIATAAGVSAGMDLGLWLTAQIGGEERARAVQLGLEYDPQPPFDSGHVSRASRRSKAMATAMLSRDVVRTGQLGAATQMAWGRTINAVRTASARRRRGSSGR